MSQVAKQEQLQSDRAQMTADGATAASFTQLTPPTYTTPATTAPAGDTLQPAIVSQPPAGTSTGFPGTAHAAPLVTNAGYVNLPDQPMAYRMSHTLPPPTATGQYQDTLNMSVASNASAPLYGYAEKQYVDTHQTAISTHITSSEAAGVQAQKNVSEKYKELDADDEESSVNECQQPQKVSANRSLESQQKSDNNQALQHGNNLKSKAFYYVLEICYMI